MQNFIGIAVAILLASTLLGFASDMTSIHQKAEIAFEMEEVRNNLIQDQLTRTQYNNLVVLGTDVVSLIMHHSKDNLWVSVEGAGSWGKAGSTPPTSYEASKLFEVIDVEQSYKIEVVDGPGNTIAGYNVTKYEES